MTGMPNVRAFRRSAWPLSGPWICGVTRRASAGSRAPSNRAGRIPSCWAAWPGATAVPTGIDTDVNAAARAEGSLGRRAGTGGFCVRHGGHGHRRGCDHQWTAGVRRQSHRTRAYPHRAHARRMTLPASVPSTATVWRAWPRGRPLRRGRTRDPGTLLSGRSGLGARGACPRATVSDPGADRRSAANFSGRRGDGPAAAAVCDDPRAPAGAVSTAISPPRKLGAGIDRFIVPSGLGPRWVRWARSPRQQTGREAWPGFGKVVKHPA